MGLGDAVSKLETFVWILNQISRSITWSLFTVKASNLVKWPISTSSFMWWCQFIDWLKFETRPSSLMNFGTAYLIGFRIIIIKITESALLTKAGRLAAEQQLILEDKSIPDSLAVHMVKPMALEQGRLIKRVRTGTARPANYEGIEEPEGMIYAPIERLLKDIIKANARSHWSEIGRPTKMTSVKKKPLKQLTVKKGAIFSQTRQKNLNLRPAVINQPVVIKHRRRVWFPKGLLLWLRKL